MDELALKRNTGTFATTASYVGANKIHPFPQTKWAQETDQESEIINLLMGSTRYENYLKEFIEGVIMNNLKSEVSTSMITKDNPFDPIYLAQLEPDVIRKEDMDRIKYFASRIVDRSNELFIDDGWDN